MKIDDVVIDTKVNHDTGRETIPVLVIGKNTPKNQVIVVNDDGWEKRVNPDTLSPLSSTVPT